MQWMIQADKTICLTIYIYPVGFLRRVCCIAKKRVRQLLSWEKEGYVKVINRLKRAEVTRFKSSASVDQRDKCNSLRTTVGEDIGTPTHPSKIHLLTANDPLSRIH